MSVDRRRQSREKELGQINRLQKKLKHEMHSSFPENAFLRIPNERGALKRGATVGIFQWFLC